MVAGCVGVGTAGGALVGVLSVTLVGLPVSQCIVCLQTGVCV